MNNILHYKALNDINLQEHLERITQLVNNIMERLLCDKCDKGYHMYFLYPILFKIPVGEWFCDICSHKDRVKGLNWKSFQIHFWASLNEFTKKHVMLTCPCFIAHKLKWGFFSSMAAFHLLMCVVRCSRWAFNSYVYTREHWEIEPLSYVETPSCPMGSRVGF